MSLLYNLCIVLWQHSFHNEFHCIRIRLYSFAIKRLLFFFNYINAAEAGEWLINIRIKSKQWKCLCLCCSEWFLYIETWINFHKLLVENWLLVLFLLKCFNFLVTVKKNVVIYWFLNYMHYKNNLLIVCNWHKNLETNILCKQM